MGYALLKAKSSKILKQDGLAAEDETAEGICSLYVYLSHVTTLYCCAISDQSSTNATVQSQIERFS